MLPKRYDIDKAYADVPVRRTFRWTASGTPVDLTGWTGTVYVGLNGTLVQQLSGAVITGANDGLVALTIPANTFVGEGTYRYVLDLIDPDNVPTRFVVGAVDVRGMFP